MALTVLNWPWKPGNVLLDWPLIRHGRNPRQGECMHFVVVILSFLAQS